MEIHDTLFDTVGTRVNRLAFLALTPLQSVKTEEKSILGADDMLFCFVTPKTAELDKVSGVANGIGYS